MTEEDRGKQPPNRLETAWDDKEVARLATELERIASEWGERISLPVQVLRALCDLVANNPSRIRRNQESGEWGFEGTKIGEAMLDRFKKIRSVKWPDDPETAKSRMNEHWPKLQETWERQQEAITDGLNAMGFTLRPTLHRQEGGGSGNYTRYGLIFESAEEIPSDDLPCTVDLRDIPPIRYVTQDISGKKDISGGRLRRWLSERGFFLGGWIGGLYIGIFLLLVAALAVWGWHLIGAMAHSTTVLKFLKISLVAVMTFGGAYLLLGWHMRLATNRVTRVPSLLQLFSKYDDYLLELRPREDSKKNAIYLVRYTADCPICGKTGLGKVRVESGRLEFFGRLVGRCAFAPNAHVFSFDHVSRQGVFLRSSQYGCGRCHGKHSRKEGSAATGTGNVENC